MTAFFDFHFIRGVIAVSARWVLGNGEFGVAEASSRPVLVQRWRRDENGKLEGRWERGE